MPWPYPYTYIYILYEYYRYIQIGYKTTRRDVRVYVYIYEYTCTYRYIPSSYSNELRYCAMVRVSSIEYFCAIARLLAVSQAAKNFSYISCTYRCTPNSNLVHECDCSYTIPIQHRFSIRVLTLTDIKTASHPMADTRICTRTAFTVRVYRVYRVYVYISQIYVRMYEYIIRSVELYLRVLEYFLILYCSERCAFRAFGFGRE